MNESLILDMSSWPDEKSLHSLLKSISIRGQHFLINFSLKPSGPGAWSTGISFSATEISSSVKGGSIVGGSHVVINDYRSKSMLWHSLCPNLCLNGFHRALAFRWWLIMTNPSSSCNCAILLALFLIVATAWKTLVFSSPNLTQRIVALCYQYFLFASKSDCKCLFRIFLKFFSILDSGLWSSSLSSRELTQEQLLIFLLSFDKFLLQAFRPLLVCLNFADRFQEYIDHAKNLRFDTYKFQYPSIVNYRRLFTWIITQNMVWLNKNLYHSGFSYASWQFPNVI